MKELNIAELRQSRNRGIRKYRNEEIKKAKKPEMTKQGSEKNLEVTNTRNERIEDSVKDHAR